MNYCQTCGNEIDRGVTSCPFCNPSIDQTRQVATVPPLPPVQLPAPRSHTWAIVLGVVGFQRMSQQRGDLGIVFGEFLGRSRPPSLPAQPRPGGIRDRIEPTVLRKGGASDETRDAADEREDPQAARRGAGCSHRAVGLMACRIIHAARGFFGLGLKFRPA